MCIHTVLSMTTLSPVEQATLQALADACNCSLGAHVPAEAVARRFQKHLRGDIKKTLKKLRAKGYCLEHPTGSNTTYQLTPNGLSIARKNFSASP